MLATRTFPGRPAWVSMMVWKSRSPVGVDGVVVDTGLAQAHGDTLDEGVVVGQDQDGPVGGAGGDDVSDDAVEFAVLVGVHDVCDGEPGVVVGGDFADLRREAEPLEDGAGVTHGS
jgi:hypothetical protein